MQELMKPRQDRLAIKLSACHLDRAARAQLPSVASAFIDVAATDSGRATFYNTREEQEAAALHVHEELFAIDRGIYATALLLPGVTDRTRQLGLRRLLTTSRGASALSEDAERALIGRLLASLPPQRALKFFGALRQDRSNNARSRKLILGYILGSNALELWSVKYRRKIASALGHAWGRKTTSVLRCILAKQAPERDGKEQALLRRHVHRFVRKPLDAKRLADHAECIRFVLGDERGMTLPRLRSYVEAKRELAKGRSLPFETLEGIRGRFHRSRAAAEVLELSKSQLTTGQRLTLQRTARKAGVEVAVDLSKYDAVRLYLYAFEMGMTEKIRRALRQRAERSAEGLPVRFGRVAVIVDSSASMLGHETQPRRPIAVALALRDLFASAADVAYLSDTSGRPARAFECIEPSGDTSLATALVEALLTRPEAVFVLSDGYENAPAGRSGEVLALARRIGIETPVFQLSPVLAAESAGLRRLAAGIPATPVASVASVGLALLKTAFEIGPERGLEALSVATGIAAPSEPKRIASA